MYRRHFLSSALAAPLLAGVKGFGLDRIAAITDEVSASPEDAIAFAHKYGLKWVELREVPGGKKNYTATTPEERKAAAKQLREAGLKVSFFNSGGTKYPLPGSDPVRKPDGWAARAEKEHANRLELIRRHVAAAQDFDCPNVRVFAFGRVADAMAFMPRVADTLGELGEIARKEGARLLIENEASCNVGSCEEFAALMKLLPDTKTFAINWDANNGATSKEKPFPDGYEKLPKKRIANVHMHGRTLLDPERRLDWAAIFAALVHDGYRGCAGLETHYFDGTKIEKSHLFMRELTGILRQS